MEQQQASEEQGVEQALTEEQVQVLNEQQLIHEMLLNQHSLNMKSYNTEWIEKGTRREFDYPLAAAQEIAEFINSYGYSWWSKPVGNLTEVPLDELNCRTEIVDAVHFMLSQSIIDESVDNAVQSIHSAYTTAMGTPPSLNTRDLARVLQARLLLSFDSDLMAATWLSNPWVTLFSLCRSMNFSLEQLSARYLGKSRLNAFRQKHGYKEGKYTKLWDGKNEDNFFLAQWIDNEPVTPTVRDIDEWLEKRYAEFTQVSL